MASIMCELSKALCYLGRVQEYTYIPDCRTTILYSTALARYKVPVVSTASFEVWTNHHMTVSDIMYMRYDIY